MYYPSSENKGADQLRGYREAVFAYADCWFSHGAAHLLFVFRFSIPVNNLSVMLGAIPFCVITSIVGRQSIVSFCSVYIFNELFKKGLYT